jgi:hypothetical protein
MLIFPFFLDIVGPIWAGAANVAKTSKIATVGAATMRSGPEGCGVFGIGSVLFVEIVDHSRVLASETVGSKRTEVATIGATTRR